MLTGCSAHAGNSGSARLTPRQSALLTIPREDMGTFTRNFNPFSPSRTHDQAGDLRVRCSSTTRPTATTTPWLATEWEAAEDGKSITFTLRDGVKWSDGQPLVADDVVNTFALQKKILGGYDYLDKVTRRRHQPSCSPSTSAFSPGALRARAS